MVNKLRTIYLYGVNIGFSSEFNIKPGQGQRTHQPKCYEYKNEDEENSQNIYKKCKINAIS